MEPVCRETDCHHQRVCEDRVQMFPLTLDWSQDASVARQEREATSRVLALLSLRGSELRKVRASPRTASLAEVPPYLNCHRSRSQAYMIALGRAADP
eukprot:767042-Hanusia_phi.AAC.2